MPDVYNLLERSMHCRICGLHVQLFTHYGKRLNELPTSVCSLTIPIDLETRPISRRMISS